MTQGPLSRIFPLNRWRWNSTIAYYHNLLWADSCWIGQEKYLNVAKLPPCNLDEYSSPQVPRSFESSLELSTPSEYLSSSLDASAISVGLMFTQQTT